MVGEHTDELRWSLRSLVNVQHDRVWIVSPSLPGWVRGVGHIPVNDSREKVRNVADKVYAAASHPEVADWFQFWNDDFFALAPTDVEPRHKKAWKPQKPAGTAPTQYRLGNAREWTLWFLHEAGVSPIYSYDLTHTPLPMPKVGAAEAIDAARTWGLAAPAVKTLVGNWCRLGGVQTSVNAKCGIRDEPFDDPVWVSTNVHSWAGRAGKAIRETFPDKGPYEK